MDRRGLKTPVTFLAVMTKFDAAEVLNLAVKQATKVLSRYPTTTDPIVPIVDVEDLARRYVTNTEIAARLGTSPQGVRSVARKLGARRLSEAGYDRGREAEIVAAVNERMTNAPFAKN
jgi:hypothetical protein